MWFFILDDEYITSSVHGLELVDLKKNTSQLLLSADDKVCNGMG